MHLYTPYIALKLTGLDKLPYFGTLMSGKNRISVSRWELYIHTYPTPDDSKGQTRRIVSQGQSSSTTEPALPRQSLGWLSWSKQIK
jgi:hypothetical protein